MDFSIPHNHPALSGHFPGNPVVPGVLILEAVLVAASQQTENRILGVVQTKFLSVLLPDERCLITLTHSIHGLRFSCAVNNRTVATGLLTLANDQP